MISKRLMCVHLLTLALIIAVTFFNCFHSSFKMDDHDFFNDPKIKNPKLLVYNWIPEPDRFLGLSKSSEESSYRPVTNTVLALLYRAFGHRVEPYHGVMLVLFFAGCALIYWFVVVLSKDALLAFLSAVLFAVHPVNGLAVNYVVACAYGIQLIFAMLCLIIFVQSYLTNNRMVMLALGLLMFVVSLGVHETSLIIPIYLLVIGWYLKRESWPRILMRVGPFFAVLAAYLVFRMRYASLHSGVLDKYRDFQMSVVEYAATFVKLISWYLSQLIVPDGTVLMWSTKVVRDDVWLWILLGGILVAASLWFIRKSGRTVLSVALLIFLAGFGPILGACLFRPTTGLIMEPHWMYFPAVGFFILCAAFLVRLIRSRAWIGVLLCVGLLTALIRISHVYNDIWSDEKSYGYFWLEKAPAFKTTHFFIAYSLIKDKQFELARKFLLEAREGIFGDWQIYGNLGLMDFEERNYDRAIENYHKALSFNPDASEVYNNLAVVYERQGRIQEAIGANRRALELNRLLIEPRLNLARIALSQNDLASAVKLYRENLEIIPYDQRSMVLYLTALIEHNEREQFEIAFNDLLENCREVSLLTKIATLAAEKRFYVPALDLYMLALQIDPGYAPAYIQSGVLLANLNDFDRAVGLWKQALEIRPGDSEVLRLIEQAKQSQEKHK